MAWTEPIMALDTQFSIDRDHISKGKQAVCMHGKMRSRSGIESPNPISKLGAFLIKRE
jgi:hypothetical protein